MLAACGFSPLYGGTAGPNNVPGAFEEISIASIPERHGQILRNALMDRIYRSGTPAAPQYRVEVNNLSLETEDLVETIRADVSREQVTASGTLRLIDLSTGEELFAQRIRAIGSYNVLDSQFATRISEREVTENVLNELALRIERALAVYFAGQSAS